MAGLAATLLIAPGSGMADDVPGGAGAPNPTTPSGAPIAPPFDEGYATEDQLAQFAGTYSFKMDKCDQDPFDEKRVVRATISHTGNLEPSAGATLLFKAAQYAWEQCPRAVVRAGFNTPTGRFYYNISEIDVYSPDGTLILQASLGDGLHGDMLWDTGASYRWSHLRWPAFEQAQHDAQVNAQIQAQATAQAAFDQSNANAQATLHHAGQVFRGWVRGVVLCALALFLWFKRVDLLRFYYGLTPHPASSEVANVVDFGQPYDPNRLSEVLRRSADNPIEREVRARQAAELLNKLNAHSARTKAELDDETAYLKTRVGLADGLEMHARIKRRLDAILQAQGKTA